MFSLTNIEGGVSGSIEEIQRNNCGSSDTCLSRKSLQYT